MAETKTKPKRRPTGRGSGSSKSASKPAAARPKRGSASRSRAAARPSGNGSAARRTRVEAVRQAVGGVGGRAKGAGRSVGKAASKARVPLLAGGAAVAGAAGGMALVTSRQARRGRIAIPRPRRPRIKVDSGDVARAAREVGNFSVQIGELAGELQRARESADGARHRSPIEVVLQGLTARR